MLSTPRRPRSGASWPLIPALAIVFLISGCYGADDPVAVEQPVEPSATILPAGTSIPVPAGLQGCGDATAYDTGDPANPQALYLVCWPSDWNGSFILYAHGYVSAFEPLAIPGEADGDGADDLAAFATGLGFGFATTSYRLNGLAIPEGTEDLAALSGIVRAEAAGRFPSAGPVPILVTGASEGGAVATLAAEQYPRLFQGALATCGPTGDFQKQLNYFGDFNVLFNYYFPSVFADGSGGFLVSPSGVAIDPVTDWGDPASGVFGPYALAAAAALAARPGKAIELLRVAGVPVDPGDPQSAANALFGLLWYNVYATEDATAKLGGRPFDNRWRWYRGSSNDWRLNRKVQRFSADPAARNAVASDYQTTGQLDVPYVSLHTTGDEIVQFAQQPIYRLKALVNGSAPEHSAFPVLRYGHCNFEEGDLTAGLGLLLLKVGATTPTLVADAMSSEAAEATFWELASH